MSRWAGTNACETGLVSRRISAGVLGAVAAVLVLFPGLASACSCGPRSASAGLAAGVPAVIGEVVAATEFGTVGAPPYDHLYAYTVRVERAFNLDIGTEITIHGNTNGGACGFTWSAGQRVGAFLYRTEDRWATSSCGLVAPEELEAAAAQPPPGDPAPPAAPAPGAENSPDEADRAPVVRAFHGRRAVLAGARFGAPLERLAVKPSARIRLRLDAPAQAVRVALARPNGKRVGRTRRAQAIGRSSLAWRTTLPRRLPRGADRLLVSIDYGTERVVRAVGLATRCRPRLRG